MSDLISRKATVDEINERQRKLIYCFGFENDMVKIMDIAKSMVLSIPSAQPEIIRCKDCEYYEFADNRAFGFPVKRCEVTGFEDVDDDDFCSRAERRTDGSNRQTGGD